ncbi:MAG TPA: arginase family protein [Bacteriovoracaceae bacterium]|nr:arginase family protein [Bacteriovoracaceae bacterium]
MRGIKLLGLPFFYGQPNPGVRLAPEYLRRSGLVRVLEKIARTKDLGDLNLDIAPRGQDLGGIKKEHQSALANFRISNFIEKEALADDFLLNVGGDHGLGLGVLHGLLHQRPNMVVVWADAHGDINTPESSSSGNFHGMPLSFILNGAQNLNTFSWLRRKLSPSKLIFMGPRSLDPYEREILRSLKIQYYSSQEINQWGSRDILKDALRLADPHGTCPIHLSLDVDLFDPGDVVSTGTVEGRGPKMREVFSMGRVLGESGRLRSMDVVELNTEIGSCPQVDATFQVALDFIKCTLKECFRNQNEQKMLSELFQVSG